MNNRWSIRARLVWGGGLILLAFLAGAGWAVQQAWVDSVRQQRFARLQTTVYLLLAAAELDTDGDLVMPATLAEPRLGLPGSGLYASITRADTGQQWQSASTLGRALPFARSAAIGQWQFDTRAAPQTAHEANSPQAFLAATYAVKWSASAHEVLLVFSVLEDKAAFDREHAAFASTLWRWLGGTGLLLLLTQTVLLRWGLKPLQRMSQEVAAIEKGGQTRIEGHYPAELAGLMHNLNLLIEQERARQKRFKEALDDLAHSLKTPLAVLRATLLEPAELPARVAEQVARMDDIVVHQLGRAAASGAARFAPLLALAPLLERVRSTLAKVYLDKALKFTVDCPADLRWRMDEGDAFEMLGNVLDNAAKWAQHQITVRLWLEAGHLHIRVTDDGPGFADAQAGLQRRLRLDEQVPGHGIGLAVVRDLVASHQGDLTISRANSGGAQLDIILRST
jgi:two-component system sensor histidine kinase PhoQ